MNKKKRNIIIGVVAAVVVIFAVVFAIFAIPVLSIKDGQILSGVYLGPIDVSNCTKEEAAEKIEEYFKDYNKGKIALKAGSAIEEYDISDLKLSLDNEAVIQSAMDVGRVGNLFERYNAIKKLEHDTITVDIKINVDNDAVEKLLKEFAEEFDSEAVEPTIKHEKGTFIVTEGKAGIVLDEEKSKTALKDYLTNEWLSEKKIVNLVADIKEPRGNAEQLSKIKDVLGTYSTDTIGAPNRVHNLKVGADYLNGTVLYPGETMSTVDVMRDADGPSAGYVEAGVYLNGKTAQGYGGGICQVATTLYNAVILAELEIVERHEHQMIVGYVPPSMDATISAGSCDLVIKNNTANPIFIESSVGSKVNVTVYGVETRPETRKVTFISETLSEEKAETQIELLEDKEIGYFEAVNDAHDGSKARAWKVVYENGVEVSRELFNSSTYRRSDGIYRMGLKGVSDEVRREIQHYYDIKDIPCLNLIAEREAAKAKESSESSSETESGESTSAATPEPVPTGN